MTNFTERAVPTITANFLMKEAESRYWFANKFIKAGETVLDMACGTGYGAQILVKKAGNYIGIDIDDEALRYAKSRYENENISFIKMNATSTIFNNKSFESIISFEMIEHLKNQKSYLTEVSRILSKGGVFIVSTPNRLTQSPDGKWMSPYHTKEFSPSEFRSLLEKYFSKVKIYGERKNEGAKQTVEQFMFSQKIRQLLVDIDFLKIRRIFTNDTKELLWKHLGNFVGRKAQDRVQVSDFIITSTNLSSSEYLIALCKK